MILVTGGAGYIGSHTLRALQAAGHHKILVLDNLYSGHRWAVPSGIGFIEESVGDAALLKKIFEEHPIESILHFAAHLEVEESMREPAKYYDNNFKNSSVLIATASEYLVKNFVFSSTCAIYGSPAKNPVDEDCPKDPLNPYGKSKLMTEWYLEDLVRAGKTKMNYVSLRYFNVAGAHVPGGLGQATPRATQLIKVAAEVACGKRDKLLVYGSDYGTRDGTCIRDYIHVDDLAAAHVLALDFLKKEKRSEVMNLGYGHGYTVLEIADAMKRVSGVDFEVELATRRPGDSEAIYADNSKLVRLLGWKPRYADIDLICRTALEWERTRL
ncbi:MAG: UDP-glucose 4-epimerase GalE [Bdellovibrionota bacterium]